MGNCSGKPPSGRKYEGSLPQEKTFVDMCRRVPKDEKAVLSYDAATDAYTWTHAADTAAAATTAKVSVAPPRSELAFEGALMLSAGSYAGTTIDHLLDGYSCAIVLQLDTDEQGRPVLRLENKVVQAGRRLHAEEQKCSSRKPGLFTGDISVRKMIGHNLYKLLVCKDRAVERDTSHQPIYFPPKKAALFCGAAGYHSYTLGAKGDTGMSLEAGGWQPDLKTNDYSCMHPHYDQRTQTLLTYTFSHALTCRQTTVVFQEIGKDGAVKKTPYTIDERAALHMFGFTENYYVLFANPLRLSGGCFASRGGDLLLGKPVMLALDDSYVSNLVVHFVPRPGRGSGKRSAFCVETRKQGFVYHTINCYEKKGGEAIVVDCYVSILNAARESSQFELAPGHDVFDHSGDPYRFEFAIPARTKARKSAHLNSVTCRLVASLSGTIDFHCINPSHNGLEHRYAWILGHSRLRNANGQVEQVVSLLSKMDYGTHTGLKGPSLATHTLRTDECMDTWGSKESVYLRTPLFVPRKGSTKEDDGYLFLWSYEGTEVLRPKLIVLDASDLRVLWSVQAPCHLPYSVHSWVYPFAKC